MKLLFYSMSFIDKDLLSIFDERKIEYRVIKWKFESNEHDEGFEDYFEKNIDAKSFDACFSVDYWPVISKCCQKHDLRYIAWSYDTPPNVKNIEETLGNSVNRVFWFDRTQYARYKDEGFDNVYHMPLGVNPVRLKTVIPDKGQHKLYDADISLVGKLYDSDYTALLSIMPDEFKTFFNTLVDTQGKIFDHYIIDDMITRNIVDRLNLEIKKNHPEAKLVLQRETLTYAVASEVTRRERIILLTLCGKRYKTKLYSYQNSDVIQNVEKCPPVDYIKEMPYVFACSKINLNPAFCMIESGASLRALDILGAGGFLLTRHQQELTEMYKDGEDMVVYKDYGDAIDKVEFYMTHDDIRERIRENGRRKTFEEHNLQKRLDDILKLSGL